MSCRSTALSAFIVVLLRVQSVAPSNGLPSMPPYDLPEIDGSAVDTCRVFPFPTPEATTTSTTTTATTAATTTPVIRKVVASTTIKPRKPENKNSGSPVRPQPAPARPISGSHSDINSLLRYLLANSRRHAAGSNGLISQPIRGLRHRADSSSDSDDVAVKIVGRRAERRWKIASVSSEDSSDES